MLPILAYHAVFSAYGFWPPNDQRGSWSTEVWARELRRFGEATKTTEKRSLADRSFDRDRRDAIRDSLQYPPVRFSKFQIECIGRGFEIAVEQFHIKLFGCAILWDHVHLIVANHKKSIEFIARIMKLHATRQLTGENLHPLAKFADTDGRAPTPWAKGGWRRYMHQRIEVADAIGYVNGNPRKHGLPEQDWKFVKPFAPKA